MVTITINERTKAGKTLVELANLLAKTNKEVIVSDSLNKSFETIKQTLPKINKQSEITELSKKINKSMTKKLFHKMGIDYDSYNR